MGSIIANEPFTVKSPTALLSPPPLAPTAAPRAGPIFPAIPDPRYIAPRFSAYFTALAASRPYWALRGSYYLLGAGLTKEGKLRLSYVGTALWALPQPLGAVNPSFYGLPYEVNYAQIVKDFTQNPYPRFDLWLQTAVQQSPGDENGKRLSVVEFDVAPDGSVSVVRKGWLVDP